VAANVHLTEQRNLLQQAHDDEAEVYRTNQAYRQTKTLTQLDATRDKKFSDVKFAVSFYLRMGSEAQKAAAEAVEFVLQPYRQGPAKGYQDNTAELGKFVTDMAAEPYPAHIAALGLTETLAGLRADNDAFRAAYETRSEDELDRAGHEKIRNLRHKFDDTWRIVATVLPSLHFVETDAARKTLLGRVIDEINAYILQVKKVLAARGIGSASVGLVDVEHDHEADTQPIDPPGGGGNPSNPDEQPIGPPSGGGYIDPNA
jgi:hypothetical protein